MTATVPCDGHPLDAAERRAGARHRAARTASRPRCNALFVTVTSAARRRHRPQRRGRQCAAGAGRHSPDCRAHRDHLVGGRHVRDFVGLTKADGIAAAHRLRRPEPAARDRRRVHRPDRPRAARAVGVGDHRHPVHHARQRALKLAAMLLAISRPIIALRRAVAAGPARRPADAPPHPVALAHLHRHRRRGGRRLPALARHRRQLLRRRLHLADGPRRRPCRLHVELLPLVRQPRGSVRLVLQPARADDPASATPASGSGCPT